MKNYVWKSTLAEHFQTYISVQQTAGFKFVFQERILQHFDHYHFYSGYQGTRLTRDILSAFIYNKEEAASTWRNKEIVLHGFICGIWDINFTFQRLKQSYQRAAILRTFIQRMNWNVFLLRLIGTLPL